MINLGDEVKDVVTGFKGIAIARTEWLNGCERILIQERQQKPGVEIREYQVDIAQVKVLKAGAVKLPKQEVETGGGDMIPTRRTIKR